MFIPESLRFRDTIQPVRVRREFFSKLFNRRNSANLSNRGNQSESNNNNIITKTNNRELMIVHKNTLALYSLVNLQNVEIKIVTSLLQSYCAQYTYTGLTRDMNILIDYKG